MNVVVLGMSPREEVAFGIFWNRFMPDWRWRSTEAGSEATPGPTDLIVANLGSLGLAHWSEVAEAKLQALLHGAPAVLLVPANDRSWSALQASTLQPAWVWLPKPYGAQEMCTALKQAAHWVGKLAAAVVAPAPQAAPAVGAFAARGVSALSPVSAAVAVVVTMPALAAVRQVASQAAVARPPVTPAAVPGKVLLQGLSARGLKNRLAAMPAGSGNVFLHKLSAMLALGRPFEARFTVQNALVVHPEDGWIATNTPMLVIERVCQSDTLASAVSVREMDEVQAEERALGMAVPPRELEAFLWELVAATQDKAPQLH
jgi:hypothetical protein